MENGPGPVGAERGDGGVLVSLVGAGPGAADLITLRGFRRLAAADVVIYDDLLEPELLDIAARAERLYVGKRAGRVHTPQAEICELLVRHAAAGRRVVRLKGGDPMIFGRATEEMKALREAGIAFEVVPGVTSAAAAAGASGFSLTERHVASAVVFVTGHECAGKLEPAVRWSDYAKLGATLCVYMGAGSSARIAGELVSGGLPASTPVAAASSVSHAVQSLRSGELRDLAAGALVEGLPTPVVLVIGEVARSAAGACELVRESLAA